ncbi:hypothetical protein BH23BAC2_BH23BAC2_12310 [soil metagenome]
MASKTQDFLLLIKCYKKNDLQDGTTVQNIETEDFQLNETCFKDREELWDRIIFYYASMVNRNIYYS